MQALFKIEKKMSDKRQKLKNIQIQSMGMTT